MFIKYIILTALFANFFGFYIVQTVALSAGVPRLTPFVWNNYSLESIIELAIVFAISAVAILLIPYRKKSERIPVSAPIRLRYIYWIITIFLFSISALNFANINFSFQIIGRGVGQFDRDIGTALSRLSLLILPLVIVYRVTCRHARIARVVTAMVAASYSLVAISNGDRRILLYYLIALGLIKFREQFVLTDPMPKKKKPPKKRGVGFLYIIYAAIAVSVLILSYYIRAINDVGFSFKILLVFFLHSTFGGLGIGAILAEVKMFVAGSTGFLNGATFVNYILSIAAPSALLVALGGSEFFLRSSLLFNDLFNDNPNQGYDFMMVADFYWNFGYFGYFLFLGFVFFLARFYIRAVYRGDDVLFVYAALILIFFIAGQRSDFGLFLKSSIYTIVFAKMVFFLLRSPGKITAPSNEKVKS